MSKLAKYWFTDKKKEQTRKDIAFLGKGKKRNALEFLLKLAKKDPSFEWCVHLIDKELKGME